MDSHKQPIALRIEWLMELARKHSALFPVPRSLLPGSAIWLSIRSKFAADVIRAGHPDLALKMQVRTAVLDWRSRKLEIIAPE
ncbi:MAG: hypothetical protein AAB177_03325 [Nitrospirota bacterium]